MEDQQLQNNGGKRTLAPLAIIVASLIVVGGGLAALYLIPKAIMAPIDILNKYLGSKTAFDATFVPIVSEREFQRLQFYQRNQVCLFRVVRYRGSDKGNHTLAETYKAESDKTPLEKLQIFGNQYCEWEAKGSYEFNFYVDMSDLSKWGHDWNEADHTLTLYPPDIEANTPAELEAPVYRCIADSVSIDEGFTKEELTKSLPTLKLRLAADQKQFMYSEAKDAIAKHYRQFFKLIPNLKVEKFPQIDVVFPHERKIDKKKL